MTELQKRLVEMLGWFHNFCVENDLKYYVAYGTLIGAVRHQGFIPWDDDIDVHMPREDYEKLIELFSNKVDDDYILESYHNRDKDFIYTFVKLYDTRTTLIETTRKNVVRGIYLDVFPLDEVPNDEKLRRKHLKKINFRKNLLASIVCAPRKGRALIKNLCVYVMRLIPSCILNIQGKIKKIDLLTKKYQGIGSGLYSSFHATYMNPIVYKEEVFGEPKEYDFAGVKVFGPQDYDGYLRPVYRDYMTPPPEDKRNSGHVYSYLDLNTPYKK